MRRRYFWVSRFDLGVDLGLSGFVWWFLDIGAVVPRASEFIIVVLAIVALASAVSFQ